MRLKKKEQNKFLIIIGKIKLYIHTGIVIAFVLKKKKIHYTKNDHIIILKANISERGKK